VPKRNERVSPPAPPGGWELRYADKAAVDGWEELVRSVPGNLLKAWEALSYRPDDPSNPDRQHRLKGELGSRMVGGRNLAQWQYEVSGSGRIWYCPDPTRRIVWLALAATGHPRQTD
jgi:hypothetical protein